MDETLLHKLSEVHRNQESMDASWKVIEQASQKKRSYNLMYPIVVITALTTLLLLIISGSEQPKLHEANASTKPTETVAAVTSTFEPTEKNPTSKWYLWVDEVKNKEYLQQLNGLLTQLHWQQVAVTIPENTERFKFTYSDGEEKIFLYHYEDEREFLVEETTRFGYILEETDATMQLYYSLHRYVKSDIYYYLFYLGILLLISMHNYFYKRKHKLDRNPPFHTTYWQTIVFFATLIVLGICSVIINQFHFVWWIIGTLVSLCILLAINKHETHHAWRIRTITFQHVLVIVIAIVLYFYI